MPGLQVGCEREPGFLDNASTHIEALIHISHQLYQLGSTMQSAPKASLGLGEHPPGGHLQTVLDEPWCLQTGEAARLRMVKSNERLVWHVARKYQNRGLDIEDLIAEGMNGLLKGVEKFDPNKGFKFSTYAHWWVRQGITRAISEQVIITHEVTDSVPACWYAHGCDVCSY